MENNALPEFERANVGDFVKFGRYPQESGNEPQPVEWQVLSKENGQMLVISRYGLDAKRFDGSSNNWGNSEIRKWLNSEFYTGSFTAEEKARIISFNQDNVFLLSYEEAEKYFSDDDARKCKPTSYAKAKGAWTGDDGCGYWWLRSPRPHYWWLRSPRPYNGDGVYYVYYGGDIDDYRVDCSDGSARPALWINLDEQKESKARSERLGSGKSGVQKESKARSERLGSGKSGVQKESKARSERLGSGKSGVQKESKARSERLGSGKSGLESLKSSGSNSLKNAKIGDYVKFGSYPQTAEGELRPVEWQVLARENNKALVISRYALDARRFDPESNDWSKSEIRRWLNSEFYNSTFSGEEKARIKSFNQDYVFLLSYEEAGKYFADDDARKCKPTAYAKAKGAWIGKNTSGFSAVLSILLLLVIVYAWTRAWNNGYGCGCYVALSVLLLFVIVLAWIGLTKWNDDCGYWWLRSPYPDNGNGVYYVYDDGDVFNDRSVSDNSCSVRPALWINLDEQKGAKARSECLSSGKSSLESLKSSGSNPFKNAKIGDYVKFGRYPQTAKGEVQPVEWQVLARENNKALVISRYGLAARRFDGSSNNWSKSEIRKWLNSEFYNSTFSGEEKARIKSFNQDNVFLLSKEEAEKYFSDYDARKCKPTSYAEAKGAFEIYDFCWWWLRSPSPIDSVYVYRVGSGGGIFDYCFCNYDVHGDCGSVRPALWINL